MWNQINLKDSEVEGIKSCIFDRYTVNVPREIKIGNIYEHVMDHVIRVTCEVEIKNLSGKYRWATKWHQIGISGLRDIKLKTLLYD